MTRARLTSAILDDLARELARAIVWDSLTAEEIGAITDNLKLEALHHAERIRTEEAA